MIKAYLHLNFFAPMDAKKENIVEKDFDKFEVFFKPNSHLKNDASYRKAVGLLYAYNHKNKSPRFLLR